MNQALTVQNDLTLAELGNVFVKSGFFSDTRDSAQAIVKIIAGRELGFGPMASMTGVYIVKGRVSIAANLMAAAVKRTTKYNYRVLELSDTACEIVFYEAGQDVGHSRFTVTDAQRAGTQNMDKFPRNMLFARAMSNGVKWYCADVFGGPVYTPEEMGAAEDGDGNVVEMPAVARPPAPVGAQESNPEGEFAAPPVAPPKAPAATASLKVKAKTAAWTEGCAALAEKYPAYQDAHGKPAYYHILGAARKCLYTVVDDSNVEQVLVAISERAENAVS